jgi:hypothetical protein
MVERQDGSPSARRSRKPNVTKNQRLPIMPSVEAAITSCAHVASMLPKYLTASAAVASRGGSSADANAMIGPNSNTTNAMPMIPVVRASAAYRPDSVGRAVTTSMALTTKVA